MKQLSHFQKCLMASAFWYPSWTLDLLESFRSQGIMN